MRHSISNTDDTIDSRDVIARIEELQGERENHEGVRWADVNEDDAEELRVLEALAKEGEDYAGDWQHGATLIADRYFEEYAQELAEDIGAISQDAPWPACHIDWRAAADALKADYTSIDFDGKEYWVRS